MLKESLPALPVILFAGLFFCMTQCSDYNKQAHQYRPTQTYQCDFHDKPLVLVSWRGNTSIRRYKMKDMERGTVISGIRHYARKCKALPLKWEDGAGEKADELMSVSDTYCIWGIVLFFLSFASIFLLDHIADRIEAKICEKSNN